MSYLKKCLTYSVQNRKNDNGPVRLNVLPLYVHISAVGGHSRNLGFFKKKVQYLKYTIFQDYVPFLCFYSFASIDHVNRFVQNV